MPTQEIHLSPQQRRAARQVLGRNQLSQLTDFPRYPVRCPLSELVHRFEGFAGPIWSRLHANMTENQTLAELRDTRLPKLLSGEIRIKDAEEQAGAVL
ncbi:hypothetical protein ACN28E_37905 [Archangium lansingense]|uniref:hypothetical protein n=1 Tax=Archangium lansingense TaxID=2995310 RepID=UPI003B811061